MKIGLQGVYGLVPFTCSDKRVLTFQDLQVERSARYASHEIIGQKPVNEFIGPDSDKVSFKIQLIRSLGTSPAICLATLREMLESGKAYKLILGKDYFGEYILSSLTEDRKHYDGRGGMLVCDVTLNLTEAKGFSLVAYAKSMVSKII